MAKLFDAEQILQAIWDNPTPATGLHFTKKGDEWESPQRPDGTEGGRYRTDRTTLSRHGGAIVMHYHGNEGFRPDMPIWDFLKDRYSTNDMLEVYRTAAEAYGILPDYSGFSEEHRRKAARRVEDYPLIAEIANYLTAALRREEGSAAAAYLQRRGLQPSERLGAYSRAIRDSLLQHLQKCFASADATTLRLKVDGLLRCYNPDEYALALPYYNGGRITGFVLRLTAEQDSYTDADGNLRKKPKYSNSLSPEKGGSFERAGYCGRLRTDSPVIMVEGILDAERCMQNGFTNVIALGGQTPTDADGEDAARSAIETLKRYGAKKLIYVPDFEHEELKDADGKVIGYGKLRTDATRRTIAAILPHLTGSLDGRGFLSLKIAQLYNSSSTDKTKQDADSFIRTFGATAFESVLQKADTWYNWRFAEAVGRCGGEDLQAEALKIYSSVSNYCDREKIKQQIQEAKGIYGRLREEGLTTAALKRIDAGDAATTKRQRFEELAKNLQRAIDEHAPEETIDKLLKKAERLRASNRQERLHAQLNATREDYEELVRNKPDELQTGWNMYSNSGKIVRRISFPVGYYSVIAAPTGYGKTSVMMQTAISLSRETQKRFLYVSMEEDEEQLYIRALAAFIGGEGQTGKEGLWTKSEEGTCNPKGELRRVIKQGGYQEDLPLFESNTDRINALTERYWKEIAPYLKFYYGGGGEVEGLCSSLSSVVEEWKADGVEVGGVFFDYTQLMRSEDGSYNRSEELFYICNYLNAFAKEQQIAIIMGSQTNREATKATGTRERKPPIEEINLTNLGDSTGIERTAAEVYLLIRPDRMLQQEDFEGKTSADKPKLPRRTRRCLTEATDGSDSFKAAATGLQVRQNTLYIESLKARIYEDGCYCLLTWDAPTGAILKDSKAD